MKQFCKDHKFICAVLMIIFVVVTVNFAYFLQDKRRHTMVLTATQLTIDSLNSSLNEGGGDLLNVEMNASRSCGRGQGKFGPGALQCGSRIEMEGGVVGVQQVEYLLSSLSISLSENDFSFKQADLEDVDLYAETMYLSDVFSLVHDPTKIECGLWYEYLNDEEKNEKRMHPVELPYLTLTMGCNDTTRLERLLDREILR